MAKVHVHVKSTRLNTIIASCRPDDSDHGCGCDLSSVDSHHDRPCVAANSPSCHVEADCGCVACISADFGSRHVVDAGGCGCSYVVDVAGFDSRAGVLGIALIASYHESLPCQTQDHSSANPIPPRHDIVCVSRAPIFLQSLPSSGASSSLQTATYRTIGIPVDNQLLSETFPNFCNLRSVKSQRGCDGRRSRLPAS